MGAEIDVTCCRLVGGAIAILSPCGVTKTSRSPAGPQENQPTQLPTHFRARGTRFFRDVWPQAIDSIGCNGGRSRARTADLLLVRQTVPPNSLITEQIFLYKTSI
jgi:hypothetical protein